MAKKSPFEIETPRNYALEALDPIPENELGQQFLERWFAPELIPYIAAQPGALLHIGTTLKSVAEHFTPSYTWQRPPSVFNLGDVIHTSVGNDQRFRVTNLMNELVDMIPFDELHPEPGTTVTLQPIDFLVTTPLAQRKAHALEAQERLQEYQAQGTVGYYYRVFHPWVGPKRLRIGSKVFYVDNRAIRGFATITNLIVDPGGYGLHARMQADGWRWIESISCDYQLCKPPQGYSYITEHVYTRDISQVLVTGGWLDPMPPEHR